MNQCIRHRTALHLVRPKPRPQRTSRGLVLLAGTALICFVWLPLVTWVMR